MLQARSDRYSIATTHGHHKGARAPHAPVRRERACAMSNGKLHFEPDRELDGVLRVSAEPDLPRPRVVVIGGLHGNEPCGLQAIDRVLEALRDGALPWRAGTAVFVRGNLAASACGCRHTPEGVDLNRQFDYAFESSLPADRWVHEHRRAHELRPLLEDADALLDLHSATRPTPPFAIATRDDRSFELACRLGLPWVVRGWEGPGLVGEQVVLSVLTRLERPAVGVECGQHDEPAAADVAYRCTLRFLRATGVLADDPSEPQLDEPARPLLLRLTEVLKKPSPSFRFARPLRGLERLERGSVVGGDRAIEVRLRRDAYVLLPNDEVAVGHDVLYLAQPESDPDSAATGPR
ncbi:MAG: hypothetical protein D6776_05545 [Planctomycetota bacterium]|nr:MAG: hypothetical protein D6776_05545 [Planctomycetota bacterium]